MSSWDQANRGEKLGLVWRNRKKISQIINDYLYLPFFLLIILSPPPPHIRFFQLDFTIFHGLKPHTTTQTRQHTTPQSIGRVLSFSPVVGIGTPPTPHPKASVSPPLWFRGGGAHSLAREGVGESEFRRWDIRCGTLYIQYVYFVAYTLLLSFTYV